VQKFIFDINKNKAVLISDYLDNVREHFSAEDKTASIIRFKTGNKFIPTRKYVITKTGTFNIGLFFEIHKYIKSLQIPTEVILTEKFKKKLLPALNIKDYKKLNLDLKDHQIEAVNQCFKQGRGTVVVATGGGKTLICATLIETLLEHFGAGSKIVLIVPGIQLIDQTYKEFINYGIDKNTISMFSGDNKLDLNSRIIIAGSNILLSKKQNIDWLYDVDAILIDEVHKVRASNEINKVLSKIKTDHKFGFTGTMPEDIIDQWNIIGQIGPILTKVSSHTLREENLLTQAKIKILKLHHKNNPKYDFKKSKEDLTINWETENDFIYNSEWRNDIIKSLCGKINNNILILVDRISHGEILYNKISTLGNKQVFFIRGEVEVEDREKVREIMEISNNIVCIAISNIFSTGINIKNLPYIIFALAGKAKVKIIQAIGRGLRLHENKERLIIFDIVDNFIYSTRHLQNRKVLYNNEKIPYVETTINE